MPLPESAQRGACAGKSLVEQMEDELFALTVQLMSGAAEDPELVRGEALGFARCIALIRNPYCPDVDAVRALMLERYQVMMATLSSSSWVA